MESLEAFGAWAWARHHNPWSWYIRPLFLLPFCYFAYRRSWRGLVVTLFALATSMFWFPAPKEASVQVTHFLELERRWLGSEWTWSKIVLTATVPVSLTLLAAAFWRRSLLSGLALINAIAVGKIGWSLAYAGESGRAVVPPALVGLACFNGAFLLVRRFRAGHRRGGGAGEETTGQNRDHSGPGTSMAALPSDSSPKE